MNKYLDLKLLGLILFFKYAMEIWGPHIVEDKQKRFMFIHREEEKAQKRNKHRRGIDINSFSMYENFHRHLENLLTF